MNKYSSSKKYNISKEARHKKTEKRKKQMEVSGAGVKKIPQIWKKRLQQKDS